jgi:dephospho-CoA kinase
VYKLGLTGSIGMGKSTAAEVFRDCGIPVYDADSIIHDLMSFGGCAVETVGNAFPGVIKGGAIDRALLGEKVFGNKVALARLEAILHPLAHAARVDFLRQAAKRRTKIVVLDIPLLFEIGADKLCDGVAVVTAPTYLQKIRVLSRDGMTEERFHRILKKQMLDSEKRKRADFIIQTSLGRKFSLLRIQSIVAILRSRSTNKNYTNC